MATLGPAEIVEGDSGEGVRPVHGQSGVPVDFARRPLWLVKGVERCARNAFAIGHERGA
jgi:hypothetical protein